MHGLSLASDLVEKTLKSLEDYHVREIRKIEVEVGELAGISPGELQSGFSIAASGTPLRDAELSIKIKKARIRCHNCGYNGPIESGKHPHLHVSPRCPGCHGFGVEILEGGGVTLRNLDVELE